MGSERSRDVARKRSKSKDSRIVEIPRCADRSRRNRLERDDIKWLQHYCCDTFSYDFTVQQREMIKAIKRAILYGGDQALAASRGEGKTTLFERVLLKYVLQGTVSYAILFSATAAAAEDSLASIKTEIESNERLYLDYPEVSVPVRALESTPNRAHYQLVSGVRHDNGKTRFESESSHFSWCGNRVILPRVPGSPSSGAIFATRGLDAAVRGVKVTTVQDGKIIIRRPDVAGIDDPDTEETARSEEQSKKLEDRIDKAIGGLGGQQRAVARVMLTTLQNRICTSYRFTDPTQKPTWKGKRFRFLLERPTNEHLWQEYIQLRNEDMQKGDEFGRRAHGFYLDNRREMDAGAKVANRHRFDPTKLPDGSQLEVSALQRYFNEVARIGQAAVLTEYDNDPPEEAGPVESGIHPLLVAKQLSGLPRGVIPPECVALTQGIDVGKYWLHWVVRAWRSDATGYTIDYGTTKVVGSKFKSDEGLDRAIRMAILHRMEEFGDAGYCSEDGEVPMDQLTLIDAGYRTDDVYAACMQIGLGVYPVMGLGKSVFGAAKLFHPVNRPTADKRPGDGWNKVRKGKVWLIECDADRWKAWEHDRWMTATDKAGCMFVCGQAAEDPQRLSHDEKANMQYAEQVCAEVEYQELVKGVLKRGWKPKGAGDDNHWLDASCYSDVAANMLGVRMAGPVPARTTKVKQADKGERRMTLAEMAGQ